MRQKLGQNFLKDEAMCKKIVDRFDPADSLFAEIGPGRGALTKYLAQGGRPFLVFEKDRELAALHRKSELYRTIEGDFLDWPFQLDGEDIKQIRFIGNLPYESGSAMLLKMVEMSDRVDHFVFLLQKEVVERIVAKHCSRDFSSFSILIQGQYVCEPLDILGPELFDPAPKVQSQLVRAWRRQSGRHPLDLEFHKFLRSMFLSKRKTLKNNLKSLLSVGGISHLFKKHDLTEKTRAEEVSLDLWPSLWRTFLEARKL